MRLLSRFILAVFFAGCCGASHAAAQATSPDVFLVTIDTLRADHVGCYGARQAHTPALDALAHDGVRFANAFTPSPLTNSSHASILTGLLPTNHGVTDFGMPLAASHATLAQDLKQRGYQTAAFIGAVILDSRTLAPGFDRGFDFYDNFPANADPKQHWGRVERRGMDVVEHAERWIETHPASRPGAPRRPRFVWIHLYDPHDPYEPPEPYATQYRGDLYDGEIAYADAALGTFVRRLKAAGAYDHALIVVTGDHGEGLGEHGEETHGIFLYDATLHVPMLVKYPSQAHAGTVIDAQVRTIDLAPTILEVVGASSVAKFNGASLQNVVEAKDAEPRAASGETDYPLHFGWAPLRSLRSNGYKFIEAPKPELYTLSSDPGELKNIYEPWSAEVLRSRAVLAKAGIMGSSSKSAGAVPTTTVDELRALGYLGPVGATNVPEPLLLPDPKDKIEEQNLLHEAMVESESGHFDAARKAVEQAMAKDPDSPMVLSQAGQTALDSGNSARAVEFFRRAIALKPDDASLQLRYGKGLAAAGELDAAISALNESLRIAPGQFDARALLGGLYLRKPDFAHAADQLEAALLLRPNDAGARLQLARAWIGLRSYDKAADCVRQVLAADKGNEEALSLLRSIREKQSAGGKLSKGK